MAEKKLISLNFLSNGKGISVYGGFLDAYSFTNESCEVLFERFTNDIFNSIGKKYYPVYRIADGELRFLFGYKINFKGNFIKNILKYIKYEIFKVNWQTSWGEKYNSSDLLDLRKKLSSYMIDIAKEGKLAIYWNENGLNAFVEYNNKMEYYFNEIGISLNQDNYIPFHFGQALIAKHAHTIFKGLNILIISALSDIEFQNLKNELLGLSAAHVELHRCSSKTSLTEDYKAIKTNNKIDIVLVAAGIGAAKILFELKYFNCPVIDIGSFIHVLSGKSTEAHAGFFIKP